MIKITDFSKTFSSVDMCSLYHQQMIMSRKIKKITDYDNLAFLSINIS